LREKHKLRVFESRVLRKKFGSKRDEMTGEWRRQYKVELCDLYFSSNIIWVIKSRSIKWAGHVARIRIRTAAYWVLVWESWEKETTWKT
jgi:hypothetical protein